MCYSEVTRVFVVILQGSDDDDEGMKAPLPPDNPMPPPLPPTPDQVIIRKDYDPKGKRDVITGHILFPRAAKPYIMADKTQRTRKCLHPLDLF